MNRQSQRIDFFDGVSEWSNDDYILRFWKYTQGYVAYQFRGYEGTRTQATVYDLQGVAIESLIKFSRDEYPRWVEQNNIDVTDARMFWALCRRRINWDIADWIKEQSSQDTSIPGDDPDDSEFSQAWVRVQFDRHREDTRLLTELADRYRHIDDAHRAILALYYFEELASADVAAILGMSPSGAGRAMRRAEDVMLHHAVSLAASAQHPPAEDPIIWPNAEFDAWVKRTYDAPAVAYLEYVSACFQVDVSYLVDVLRASNGERKRRLPEGRLQARTASLNDDQVREIRQRLAGGEKYKTIAADYGVSIDTIGTIKRGTSYTYVA